jgi:peptide/nickel transport system substrate-binding protein
MAIIHEGKGTGPFHALQEAGHLELHLPPEEEEEEEPTREDEHETGLLLRGERAALAVARFLAGDADLVTGGTISDLPIVRAGEPGGDALRLDPVVGLFGLSFGSREGLMGNASVRRALSMAIDRAALVAALGVPELLPRETLLPSGIAELPQPAVPAWSASALPMRRVMAARAVTASAGGEPVTLSVAIPDGPGYRLVFAHIRRDWRAIGIDAQRVPPNSPAADVRLVDAVAPADLASWYLRQFSCRASAVCESSADTMMESARIAATTGDRQNLLAEVDRSLTELTPFIPLTAPVRWSLVSPRLTGFRSNSFGRHNLAELIAARR